jgi:hypothetical protein
MDSLIELEFEFQKHSLEHGRFIVDALEMHPTGLITESPGRVFNAGIVRVSFTSPPEVASFLKLKYKGQTPLPAPGYDDTTEYIFCKKNIIKHFIKSYKKNSIDSKYSDYDDL